MLSKPWLGVGALTLLVGGVAAGYGLRPPPTAPVASLDATMLAQALQPLERRLQAVNARFDRLERHQATISESRGGLSEGTVQPSSERLLADEDEPLDEVEEQKAEERAKQKVQAIAEGRKIVERVIDSGHFTLEDRQSLFMLGGRLNDPEAHLELLAAVNQKVNDGSLKMDF